MSDLRPTAATRQRTLNYRLRLILKYGLLRGPAPRMAPQTSKPPSKPVQALKDIAWFANVYELYLSKLQMSSVHYTNLYTVEVLYSSPFRQIGLGKLS